MLASLERYPPARTTAVAVPLVRRFSLAPRAAAGLRLIRPLGLRQTAQPRCELTPQPTLGSPHVFLLPKIQPAFFSIRLVSSRFLADQHSWLPTPAVAARPRAPRNLLGFRRDRMRSLDNRPCHNAPGLLRRGSAILHMLGGLALGEAQQNLMQICSVGVPARASEGPHHQSS